ncbi:MAG: dTDP-4-dehydrorhamnose reductase [Deltaproteobacteria bacterium]|uniref:dTDP-4-dehydrorhamnose reductase n=1 Tax=Candidatus Zymogenus saltonus TaxID=2844893 RepID=A0A9D8KDE7_9DELT|nr:dTDP-4-dehydrorhamnose reductase [Candidatus Zymogenus saltonus]
MDLLVIGARGMLGRDLVDTLSKPPFEHRVLAWDIDEIDITRLEDVEEKVAVAAGDSPFKYIVNCAAYTDVDGAEVERELSYEINAVGAKNVAEAAAKVGARTVYISTDYVFNGEKLVPIREDDEPEPVNYYGCTKLAGEEFTRSMDPGALIIRTQWLFGPYGKNFVETMLNLAGAGKTLRVVDDQVGSPTYALHLAEAIGRMIELSLSGTYHISGGGSTSWYRFAREIFELTGMDVDLVPVTTEEYVKGAGRVVAKRPKNSVFDMTKVKTDTGVTMRVWRDGLSEYLGRREAIGGEPSNSR